MRWIATALAAAAWLMMAGQQVAMADAVEGAAAARAAVAQKSSLRVIARLKGLSATGRVGLAAEQPLRARLAGIGVARFERLGELPLVAIEVSRTQLEALLASGAVDAVQPDRRLRPALAQSVPLVDAPAAWKQGAAGKGQVVAILDSGVDGRHPFLKGKVVAEACFSSTVPVEAATSLCRKGTASQLGKGAGVPCPSTIEGCEHGTHVAGIAAGKGSAFSGVAPDARLISVQVFSKLSDADQCGGFAVCLQAYESDIIKALNHVGSLAGSYRIAAVNMSLSGPVYGAPCDSQPIKLAIDALRAKGIATVIAAGNDYSSNGVGYPGCVSTAITVASSTDTAPERISAFSDMAPFVDLVAPGEVITSSVPGGGFATYRGTSQATPHVAGAFAALRSAIPKLSIDAIAQALARTGRSIKDSRSGLSKPRIDIAKALASLRRKPAAAAAPTS